MKQDLPRDQGTNGAGEPQPEKPYIEYPTQWEFTLFGTSEELVRGALEQLLPSREHSFAPSHNSKGGKYHSFKLSLLVMDEADRLETGSHLAGHPHILFVL